MKKVKMMHIFYGKICERGEILKILKKEDLQLNIKSKDLKFTSTKELDSSEVLIGQDRGARAINFGLNVKEKGYNIYVAGVSGTGKTTYTKKFTREQAKLESTPNDLCYVYNFENPKEPILIKLPAGVGKHLKEDVEEVIGVLQEEIPKAFDDRNLEEKKSQIVKELQIRKEFIINRLSAEVRKENFGVKSSNTGIYLMPIKNGKILSEEEFENLSEDEKFELTIQTEIVNEKAYGIIEELKEMEKVAEMKLEEIDFSVTVFVVGKGFQTLIEKYGKLENEVLSKYLLDLKEDILINTDYFFNEEEVNEAQGLENLLPMLTKSNKKDGLENYKINLYVDNSDLEGAPVEVLYNPTYTNLIGDIEFETEGNSLSTSFMKIKNGALQRARGGYLIISAEDLLNNPSSYEALKRCLKSLEISLELNKEYTMGASISSIRPEKIDFDTKIILIGKKEYYDNLRYYDDDFNKFFKICAIFDYEMDFTIDNCILLSNFVKSYITEKGYMDFTRDAVYEIIRFSTRLAENRNKLSVKFDEITKIIIESNVFCKMDKKEMVTEKHVKKAISEREYRFSGYEEKYDELISDEIVMIDTSGEIVGQINGLAVLFTGDYEFGKPTKITATTYIGENGVVNIEKEANLSGSIHDKGIQVLTGYLGNTFAQDFPLSLSCNICFEQNYNGVDGDSASSTELYSILSSLSNIPIKQYIAVTGSVNQKGEIQAIGGVTYKVEGFHKLCKERGLTGKEGVIIPKTNIKDLVLNDDVLDDLEKGLFNIYAISQINEGIEILTGMKAIDFNEDGEYTNSCIYGLVYEKLRDYYNKTIEE